MMKKIMVLFLAVLLITTCCIITLNAFDANDYGGGDDGGGGDWGGNDGDSGSWSSGGGGESIDAVTVVFLLIILTIFLISHYVYKNQKHAFQNRELIKPSSYEGLHITLPNRTVMIENIIKENDPNFSANDFLSFAKKVYINIQTAWCKRDLSTVRIFLHDHLYDSTVTQIQAKIDQGVIYHYDSMVVNTAYLTSYAKDKQFEYLTIYLNARMYDWQEDEKTGKILRGDKTTRWDLRYKMKFMRSIGVLTKEETAETTEHPCPNCGAPVEMLSSGKCSYCDAVITTGQYSWVLSDFGTIRNDTLDEGINTDL